MLARLDQRLLGIADRTAARLRARWRWDVWRMSGMPLAGAAGTATATAAWGLGVAPQLEGVPYVGGLSFALGCMAPVVCAVAWVGSVRRERRFHVALARGDARPHERAMAKRKSEREDQTGLRKCFLVFDLVVIEASLFTAVTVSPMAGGLAVLALFLVAFRYASVALTRSEPMPRRKRAKRTKAVNRREAGSRFGSIVPGRVRTRGRGKTVSTEPKVAKA